MNDVDTIDGVVKRATRRKHSAQFKAEVLEACRQPDASAAAIARLYNLNANVVHRWRADDRKAAAPKAAEVPALPAPAFIALDVPPEAEVSARDIRIELKRGGATAVVHWPVESASSCAAWLREWLR
ncbi:transposase [Variovorax paradoxus]|uniref:transposase n=1 Tax=Variovorax paradoxus TaxID=34073 RepID=UPI003ECF0DEB